MKLIAADYDKTLLTTKDALLHNIVKINDFRDKGHLFVVATGRYFHYFMTDCNKYKIPFDYLILNQGGVIVDRHLKLIEKWIIDPEIVPKIIAQMQKYKSVKQTLFFNEWDQQNVYLDGTSLTKILFRMQDNSEIDTIITYFKKNYPEINIYPTVTKDFNLEIIAGDTSKARALQTIIQKENINKNDVYVIGDAANDIEMLKAFNGFGMKCASTEVLELTSKQYNEVSELIDDVLFSK